MKFFCEQCKAKYQIADEKVAGKTVRMKCRKCGHLIELRAEVTESSAIAHAPTPSPGSAGASGSPGHPAAAARPAAPRAPARPPPKPSALATSLTSTKPAAPRTERSGGALSGAFRNNVQREDEGSAPFDMADLAPGDDWYVAVNGVPVGPIRVAEVRRKAALGAVTEDSLVWQEGLDEWRPLRTFPDLAANVREAAASGRVSITPPPPDVRPSSPPPPRSPSMRQSSASIPSRVSPSRPMQTPAPARSNVVPFTSRLATAERLDDAPTEIGELPKLATAVADPFALPPPGATASPAAAAMAPPGDRPPIVASASLAPPSRAADEKSRKQPPWIAIGMIAGFVAFGAVAAFSIFSRPTPPPASVAQGAAAPPAAVLPAAPASVAAAGAAPTEPTASAPVAAAAPTGRGPAVAMGGAPRAAAAPTTPGRSLDLHSLAGTNVAPSEDPGGGDAPAAAGQCLSGGQVQQVIGLHQLAIRRSCWERNPTVKPTVNVSVTLTVGPDGSAQNVATSGDEASVGKCIENDVRGWHFPAMGCSQKTGFSFKFVRQ
ncbi:MAG TPA: GYF domain-containing protein [Polyangiaceae bacterium]|nr:GYF domain-containing protein [Polyangiaceae bacterium]